MAQLMFYEGGSFPLKYLGMPVGGNMSRMSSWLPLIDCFQSKLSVWKACSLSLLDAD